MNFRRLFFALALCLTVGGGAFGQTESAEIAAAQASIQPWINAVDAGDYDRSWEMSASLFQSRVSKSSWQKMAAAVRGPLGAVKERKLQSAQFVRALPGVPDGAYVVARFDTVFEHKRQAIETVTAMRERDGSWRNAGYFIK